MKITMTDRILVGISGILCGAIIALLIGGLLCIIPQVYRALSLPRYALAIASVGAIIGIMLAERTYGRWLAEYEQEQNEVRHYEEYE